MTELRLRLAIPTDEPMLWARLADAAAWDPAGPPPDLDFVRGDPHLSHYVKGWMRDGDLGLVAELDGVAVGLAWLRTFPADDAGYGFVAADVPELSIGVVASHRGRGIGRALLRALLDRVATPVSLSVAASNPARALYESEGFVEVGHDDGGSITMLRLSP